MDPASIRLAQLPPGDEDQLELKLVAVEAHLVDVIVNVVNGHESAGTQYYKTFLSLLTNGFVRKIWQNIWCILKLCQCLN